MLWLNYVLALPTVGVIMEPKYVPSVKYLERIGAFLDILQKSKRDPIVTQESPFVMTLDTQGGTVLTIRPDRVVVQYQHRIELVSKPGQLPSADVVFPVEPYSNMLDDLLRKVAEIMAIVVPESGSRLAQRIGIVATASLDRSQPPPGLTSFIAHLSAPWSGANLDHCALNLGVELASLENQWNERCTHGLTFPSQGPDTMKLVLDWQRIYAPEVLVDSKNIGRHIAGCSEAALSYFEKFGSGELSYA